MLHASVLRQTDALDAAILRVLLATDEALLFQKLERARHGGLVRLQSTRQILLTRPLAVKKAQQQDVLRIRKLQRTTCFQHIAARTSVQNGKTTRHLQIFHQDPPLIHDQMQQQQSHIHDVQIFS